MTEKHYGGTTAHGLKNKPSSNSNQSVKHDIPLTKKSNLTETNSDSDSLSEHDSYIKAGKIAVEVVKYAKSIVKKDALLIDIAENIEAKIAELGGKPAFPVNLSINEIAAHATPAFNEQTKAFGLLKVDLGVHINGCVADTAFSLDLENNEENKKLIEAAEQALVSAVNIVKNKKEVQLKDIGAAIENKIKSLGFIPIQNLSGHSIQKYDLHSGVTVPNFDNDSNKKLEIGVYAIEPFSTNGLGSVRDGKPSGIYHLQKPGSVRDNFAREVLDFIAKEYQTLPFCSRWIYKKFGTRGILALRQIEQSGILHSYAQLIEKGSGKVAQAEHTIIITEKETIISTY